MAYLSNILEIPLDGTGVEIPTLSVSDGYDTYEITGVVVTIGNYAIVPTGTPQAGTTFVFDYNASTDITTNGNTFQIFGTSLNQTELLSKLTVVCRYNGSAWKVRITGSLDQAAITTNSIANLNITTAKLANNSVTNAKLAQMADLTLKGNISGGAADPSDIALSSLTGLNYWNLTGNSGTSAGTNFLGTTDAQDLVFKVDSQEAGRITLNGDHNVSLGLNALTSFISSSGIGNVAIGGTSMLNLTTGQLNSALGNESLYNITTGDHNVAIGRRSLYVTTIGINNSAVGSASLYNNISGDNNTALGYQAGYNTTGDKNTLIGAASSTSIAGANNRIALGYGAISDVDYQFALPDDVTSIKWKGIVYTLPTVNTDGVLTNTGGVLTWV